MESINCVFMFEMLYTVFELIVIEISKRCWFINMTMTNQLWRTLFYLLTKDSC